MSERVQTAEEFERQPLSRHTWDVILSDYVLPQFSGPEALKLVREKRYSDISFIMISGVYGEADRRGDDEGGSPMIISRKKIYRGWSRAIERELEAAQSRKARSHAEGVARYLAAIVESSDDGIYGMKLDGTVVSWKTAPPNAFTVFEPGENYWTQCLNFIPG